MSTRRTTTVAAILTALLALVAVPAATSAIRDPDVWWIAAAGGDMIGSGHVPRINAYSFVDGAHPWIMHEWLFAVPYAVGADRLGPAFFALVGVFVLCLTAWVVLRATIERARNLLAGAAMAGLALGVFADRTSSARPVGVAELLALGMVVLAFVPRLGAARVAALVVLELVWANAHGSFPLGVVILAFATVASEDRYRHALAAALAAAATFVNPYGANLHALVIDYARGGNGPFALLDAKVLEYAPIWRASYFAVVSPLQVAGLATLLTLSVLAIVKWREAPRASRARAWLAVFVLLLGARHARHAELGGLLACVLLVPWVDTWFDSRASSPAKRTSFVRAVVGTNVALALSLFALTYRTRSNDSWIAPSIGGASFVHLAERIPSGARVYAPFRSAGLLIWLDFRRGVRTFFDSRNDCYSADVMETGFLLKDGALEGASITQAFDRFGVAYALVPTDAYVRSVPPFDARWLALGNVERALGASPAWSVRATEGGYTLFEKSAVPETP